MDEEKATRGRRGRKRRKGLGRICRDCAHNDEVIHGLLRNLGRHVDSFRNYRFEGSFGIDASESDATRRLPPKVCGGGVAMGENYK